MLSGMRNVDVAIVGGGVSGLCAAREAINLGKSVAVLEAQGQLGGRVRASAWGPLGDLGGAWVWEEDHHVKQLAAELGSSLHEQFGVMAGTPGQRYRFIGGASSFVARLSEGLPQGCVSLGSAVDGVRRSKQGAEVLLQDGGVVTAKAVVLALPPQLAVALQHEPELPAGLVDAMRMQPTFYATAAKASLAYPGAEAFWRDDAARGELPTSSLAYELYDSCGESGPDACIGAFIEMSSASSPSPAEVREHLIDLLARRYGDVARQPSQFDFVAWANEAWTTADTAQPRSAMPVAVPELARVIDGVLVLAGTETSQDARSVGKLESAIAAGLRAGRLAAAAAA